ncbi:hypothetical protein LZ32DRAFT_657047 [Colletotrichum eremochloae]|nr:hypothetical protein LZ32DRAFT_657047 [Colletotrichum eremochloae]
MLSAGAHGLDPNNQGPARVNGTLTDLTPIRVELDDNLTPSIFIKRVLDAITDNDLISVPRLVGETHESGIALSIADLFKNPTIAGVVSLPHIRQAKISITATFLARFGLVALAQSSPGFDANVNGGIHEISREQSTKSTQRALNPGNSPILFTLIRQRSGAHRLTTRLSHAQYDGACFCSTIMQDFQSIV